MKNTNIELFISETDETIQKRITDLLFSDYNYDEVYRKTCHIRNLLHQLDQLLIENLIEKHEATHRGEKTNETTKTT